MRGLPSLPPRPLFEFRISAGVSPIARRLASFCGIQPPPKFGGTMEIMRVTIQLPDDISAALEEQWDDVPRRSLEAIAVEAYRTGALTDSQVRRLLGFESRFQVHALLKEHHVPLQYTAADLEDDLRAQRELGILPSQ
jgi:predicted HTH domain antitoxin